MTPAEWTDANEGPDVALLPTDGLPPRETVWLFGKTENGPLSAHFSLHEFHCRCNDRGCHQTLIHPRLVDVLQTLRESLGRPLPLTSGFRCKTYNRVVGGRIRSQHTRGMAADIACASLAQVEELAAAAQKLPAVGGLGKYPARLFVHIDVRPRNHNTTPEMWIG